MKLSSTRKAIHDALSWGHLNAASNGLSEHLIYLTRIEKSIVNDDSCADVMEAAYICAAINTLKPHLSGWLKFAYSVEPSDMILVILSSKLRFDLFPISNHKKHAKLLGLASASLEDYRCRLWKGKELPNSFYCERIGIHDPNYDRDGWDDKKQTCLNAIRPWDSEAVGQVSRMVKALRGEEGSEQPSDVLESIGNDN